MASSACRIVPPFVPLSVPLLVRWWAPSLLIVVLALLGLGGCQRQPQTEAPVEQSAAPPPRPVTEWTQFRDGYLEAYFKANPTDAVHAGRHEFDGQLPDWSREGIAREIARLQEARQAAAAFGAEGAAALSEVDRFERDYLLTRIERDLFWLDSARFPTTNPAFYIDGLDPGVYLTRAYAPLEQRMRAYIDYARAVPAAAKQIEANLKMPLARPLLDRGVSAFEGLASFYRKDAPVVFSMLTDASLRKDFAEVNEQAAAAMSRLGGWLQANRGSAHSRYALGRERFAQMLLSTEQVDTTLAQLKKIGEADLERNLAAIGKACEEYLPGKAIPECIAQMSAKKPEDGPVKGARAQLGLLKTFLEQSNVVSIPGTEEALVNESPPYNRANSAYISIPGPYEKGLPAIYYISPPDPDWTPEEQSDYVPGVSDLLFTSVHEVWPGHFLQFLHSNQNPSIVGQLFVGYAFAEGWAHYSEELMWELGLGAGDPEVHIGQLGNALLRNVRFLSAIGLHTEGMSLAQSEKMFREKAFTDAGTARQQAARGTYDPAYLNYTLGKLMIRKLREDWTATRGGREGWREFHNQFLSYGGPPIPMVRKAMMGGEGELF